MSFKSATLLLSLVIATAIAFSPTVSAAVIDSSPNTDDNLIITEIYPGDESGDGAYFEFYNNTNNNALGWNNLAIKLPAGIDLPPFGDFEVIMPHGYKSIDYSSKKLDGTIEWFIMKYFSYFSESNILNEIDDASDLQEGYSYQRCQYSYRDDNDDPIVSNKFYYGKKTKGKPIKCADSSLHDNVAGQCIGLKLNEVGAYLDDDERFVEVINDTDDTVINLNNCYLSNTNTDSGKKINLVRSDINIDNPDDYSIEPGELYTAYLSDLDSMTLRKSSDHLYLYDSDAKTILDEAKYSGLKDGMASAYADNEWQDTYAPTPSEPNIVQEYPDCSEGYERDPKTHRCRLIPADSIEEDEGHGSSNDSSNDASDNLKPCKEGYYRNPATNRCKKLATANATDDDVSSSNDDDLVPCKEGYYRNPETNRCKKIVTDDSSSSSSSTTKSSSSSSLVPCKEGYYRNPETNRCKKIESSTTSQLTPCKEGYERNPATNRCVKKATSSTNKTLTPCKDGYERNPETNRCVKKKTASSSDSAKYPVKDSASEGSNNIFLIAALGIVTAICLIIAIWQYHTEIGRFFSKILGNSTDNKPHKTSSSPATTMDQSSNTKQASSKSAKLK